LVHRPGDARCPGSPAGRAALDAELAREVDEERVIDPLLGQMVGEYQVREVLGRGGMGVVYGGVQPVIDKPVAIKVLHSSLSHDPSGMKRFVSEARAVNRIRHRNIVDIFAFGSLPDGAQYLVMERLEGRTLTEYLKRRRTTSYADARAILAQVLDALEAAHQRSIVHRDLKPDNIFLCDQPGGGVLVKLMDFGIAKFADDTGSTHMTKTGVPMGTPLYMSPEHCQGRGLDHRADIYSLGVILYRMFCGSEPFTGGTTMEVMLAHMTLPPPPPRSLATIPEALERILLRCLAKNKEERPASIADLRADLLPVLNRIAAEGGVGAPEKLADAPALPAAESGALQALAGAITPAPVKRSRWLLGLGAAGGVAVIAAVAVVLLWPRPRPVAPPAPALAPASAPAPAPIVDQPRPGVLQASSKPPGAKIVVDGTDSGKVTPASVTGLAEDKPHKVQLLLEGHEPWTADPDVTVTAGGTASVQAELRRLGVLAAPDTARTQRRHTRDSVRRRPAKPAAETGPTPTPAPKPGKKRTKLIDDI
jgi:eukaryotic-like serine/threonine-protein kinase